MARMTRNNSVWIPDTCDGCVHLDGDGYCDVWETEVDTDEPCQEYEGED